VSKRAETRWLGLTLLALTISVFAWWPMLSSYPGTQTGDGPFFHKMIEAARVSVTRWHEMPLWNPYECGGVPLWDNPQGVAAAPLVWLCLLVGTTRAIQVWYVLHSVIGFWCMWIFARHEVRVSRAGAFIAAASWAFAGVHTQHFTGGHFVWAPYLYYPLAIFLWRRAEKDLRMAVGLGIVIALTIHEGATYPLPHLILLLGAETLTRLWGKERVLSIVKAGVVVVVVGFMLGASRFLPVMDQLRSHTRPIVGQEHDFMQWTTMKEIFLARSHDRGVMGQEYVWPEFGDYIGPMILGLAAVGVLVAGVERAWMLALFAYSFALMCGHFSDYAPWHVIKGHIYPFKEMRVPSRFVTMVTLFLSVYAGVAIDRIPIVAKRIPRIGFFRMALLAIALLGVGDLISVGMTWCATCFNGAPQQPVAASVRLYYGGADTAGFLEQPAQNRGRLECWEEWAFEQGAPLWQGDVPQARAMDDGATVEVANRTQNTFTIDVDVKRPSRVLVNSAYDRGWRSSVGNVVREGKQLAVELPVGRYQVKMEYWPHGLTAGLWLSLIGWIGVIAFFVRDAKKRAVTPASSTAPQSPPADPTDPV